MHISFDLDGTLIPSGPQFNTEKRGRFGTLFKIEKLRSGTKDLVKQLKKEGHSIHIYTTSFRSKIRIRVTLLYYGISVRRIVNQSENQKVLASQQINATKYPPAFNFDIHIDDLEGVGLEGQKYGFKTIIVSPNDAAWTHTVINQLTSFKKKNAQ